MRCVKRNFIKYHSHGREKCALALNFVTPSLTLCFIHFTFERHLIAVVMQTPCKSSLKTTHRERAKMVWPHKSPNRSMLPCAWKDAIAPCGCTAPYNTPIKSHQNHKTPSNHSWLASPHPLPTGRSALSTSTANGFWIVDTQPGCMQIVMHVSIFIHGKHNCVPSPHRSVTEMPYTHASLLHFQPVQMCAHAFNYNSTTPPGTATNFRKCCTRKRHAPRTTL